MVRKIIGLTGKMRSGKDTAGEYLSQNYNYTRFAFADALKIGVQAMAGFTNEQVWGEAKDSIDPFWCVTPREMLQDIGMYMREKYSDEFWTCHLLKFVDANPELNIVVTDVRFKNEADMIQNLGGYVIRIRRQPTDGSSPLLLDTATSQALRSVEQHVSEQQLFDVDRKIDNNGTIADLHRQLDDITNM